MLGAHLLQQFISQRNLLDGGEDHLAVQLIPGGGDDGGLGVLFLQHVNGGLQLLLTHLLGAGEDDGAGGFNLVVVELAEVLHVNLHLAGVGYGDKAVQLHIVGLVGGVFHSHDDIAELAHAGGLDQDAVRMELLLHILQSLVEVAHQRAADAAGGHLGDLHAGFFQEAAVDADLAELVLDQNQLLTGECLGQQFLDEGGLAGAQKTGNNINFRHSIKSFTQNVQSELNIPFCPRNATVTQKIYRFSWLLISRTTSPLISSTQIRLGKHISALQRSENRYTVSSDCPAPHRAASAYIRR